MDTADQQSIPFKLKELMIWDAGLLYHQSIFLTILRSIEF